MLKRKSYFVREKLEVTIEVQQGESQARVSHASVTNFPPPPPFYLYQVCIIIKLKQFKTNTKQKLSET